MAVVIGHEFRLEDENENLHALLGINRAFSGGPPNGSFLEMYQNGQPKIRISTNNMGSSAVFHTNGNQHITIGASHLGEAFVTAGTGAAQIKIQIILDSSQQGKIKIFNAQGQEIWHAP